MIQENALMRWDIRTVPWHCNQNVCVGRDVRICLERVHQQTRRGLGVWVHQGLLERLNLLAWQWKHDQGQSKDDYSWISQIGMKVAWSTLILELFDSHFMKLFVLRSRIELFECFGSPDIIITLLESWLLKTLNKFKSISLTFYMSFVKCCYSQTQIKLKRLFHILRKCMLIVIGFPINLNNDKVFDKIEFIYKCNTQMNLRVNNFISSIKNINTSDP